MSKWFVEIIEKATKKVEKRIDCGEFERRAEKVERGVNINLDTKNFYTRLVEEK